MLLKCISMFFIGVLAVAGSYLVGERLHLHFLGADITKWPNFYLELKKMNPQTKTLAIVSSLLGACCVLLIFLLIAAKTEVAMAKGEVATVKAEIAVVRLQAEEKEALARKAVSKMEDIQQAQVEDSKRRACLATLKQIDTAKEFWAMDNRMPEHSVVPDGALVTSNYLKEGPMCYSGGHLTIGHIGESPSCSIHGNLDN